MVKALELHIDEDIVVAADVTKGGGGGGGGGGGTVGPLTSANGSIAFPSQASVDLDSSLLVTLVLDLCRLASPYSKQ